MSVFETETMAELCIRQGLTAEGLAIYHRLLLLAPDEMTRARRRRRVAELERTLGRPAPPPAPAAAAGVAGPGGAPAAELDLRREADGLVVTWSLPADVRVPAAQLLLLRRTGAGIETEARLLRLPAARGSTKVALADAGLHSVRAAAGRLDGERFVPLVRFGVI